MKTSLRMWRKFLAITIRRFEARSERKRLQQSHGSTVIVFRGHSFRYYENGRWVTVPGEIMSGPRRIYRESPLAWNDLGPKLTPEERERIFNRIGEYLDEQNIPWTFYPPLSADR